MKPATNSCKASKQFPIKIVQKPHTGKWNGSKV
jgi:hypothetical protein